MLVAVLIGRHPEERYSVHRGYVDALARLGAHPVLVPAGAAWSRSDPQPLLERCDAVLLSGGGDVDPASYRAAPTTDTLDEVDPERDHVELQISRWAIAQGRPVLGICRGAQLLAVALGGTLVQDLPTAGYEGHWNLEEQYEPKHGIRATPGSLAETALAGAQRVNSIHHQAVADPGPQLVATAWSEDGVIEAVESTDSRAVLGVQWHPERLFTGDARHLAPFRWLLEAGR
ncbi:MAG: gamma-glutamyl-gamma-aminobutyrate hydrolase family protein [Acidimicrobiales bacterium]